MAVDTTTAERAISAAGLAIMPRWVMPLVRTGTIAADAFFAAVGFIFAFWLREGKSAFADGAGIWSESFLPYVGILAFAIPCRVVTLALAKVYRFEGPFEYSRELARVFGASVISSLLIIAWAFMFRGGYLYRDFSYSRGVFALDLLCTLMLFAAFHLAIRAVQSGLRKRGINLIPTVIVGSNQEAEQTISELENRRHLGYRVVGFVADVGELAPNTTRLGGVSELADVIRRFNIKEVIITDNSLAGEKLFEAMMALGRRRRVEFRFAPTLFDLLPQKTSVDRIGVLPMVRLFRSPLSDAQRFAKRISDLVIASVATLVSLPIWLIAAIAVKLDSPGGILFRQERVGMDGRVFLCYKFRTMKADADESVHREAYEQNIAGEPDANSGSGDSPVFGKVKDDPRITRVGRFLRRTSIDEIPQLLNVLKGEMSVVGPRPPIPYEVEAYAVWQRKRLDMKPGMTGLWQVSGRSRLTFEEMVRVDLYYIENWSLLLDAKILALTLPAVLRGDGAR
ncbi:MAG: exopolysaccharide biosynthesis polyprenyl glycosylphosphotransferase [Acidobacteria bacterium OLB17]|nr:MAG: exopolysaccharide biosynthesis polyprenyl glycosylphosphotransferase [Acidobacteria bacterium OLB17]MCZ2390389.1 sugar transferase [Acidobacteriota bacterium]